MALSFDTSASGSGSVSTTCSWSHTCTGADILFVAFYWGQDAGQTISSVKYNGVSMTFVDTVNAGTSSNLSVYYLVAPSAGANTVLVTFSASVFNSAGVSLSYIGANQTGQPDSKNKGTNTNSTTITVSTTVVASNCWGIGFCTADGATVSSLVSNKTDRVLRTTNHYILGADTNGTIGTGSQSIQFTQNAGSFQENLALYLSVAPSAASTVSGNFFPFFY